MNSNHLPTLMPISRTGLTKSWTALVAGLTILNFVAVAEISEPDNVLYGTIVIGTEFITADRTDVMVEARRVPGGEVVAAYRMGSDASLGDYYALRIPVEAFGPTTNPDASLTGQALDIVLTDGSGIAGQGSFTIAERGQVQRVNFGTATGDSDSNGLPDSWELDRFGSIGQDPDLDSDNDGQSNLNEWIAGTHPQNPDDLFKLTVNRQSGLTEVSFVALRAEGPGYEGQTRYYTLQQSVDIFPGTWTSLGGFTDVAGNNQTILLQVPFTENPKDFFRGQVRLSPGL